MSHGSDDYPMLRLMLKYKGNMSAIARATKLSRPTLYYATRQSTLRLLGREDLWSEIAKRTK